ncbi:MAG: phasin [Fimbriimonadaceae bacterium]|nr:phasin [Alphaproteobacteria bacterium]
MTKTESKAQAGTTAEMDLTATVREATEQGVEQARKAYEQIKSTAEETTNSLETSFNTATKGGADFNRKVIDAVRHNFDATFAFAQDMIGVKTPQDALEVQSKFMQHQFETLTRQGKEIAEFAGDVVKKSTQPIQDSATKAFKDMSQTK